jgi:hypothetical protein
MSQEITPARPIDAYCAGIPALGTTLTLAYLGYGLPQLLLGVVLSSLAGLGVSEFLLHWRD